MVPAGARLGAGLGVGGGLAERSDEPVPVVLELADLDLDTGRDVVDGHEERELPVFQRVDDLAVATGDLEEADAVGDELDLGQVLVEGGSAVQVVPGPS